MLGIIYPGQQYPAGVPSYGPVVGEGPWAYGTVRLTSVAAAGPSLASMSSAGAILASASFASPSLAGLAASGPSLTATTTSGPSIVNVEVEP